MLFKLLYSHQVLLKTYLDLEAHDGHDIPTMPTQPAFHSTPMSH